MAQAKNLGRIFAVIMASLSMTLSMVSPASAQAPREDVFHTNTVQRGKVQKSVPRSAMPNSEEYAPKFRLTHLSSAKDWFKCMDDLVGYYRPNVQDHMILDKPFNNEVERVTLYCHTLVRVAKNYRILAQKLHSLPIIDNMPQSKILRDNLVDWYNDSALVYEDMYRPRPPARTQEELQHMLKDITERSESLKTSYATIWGMDNNLRLSKSVDQPRYDNALLEYAEKARPENLMREHPEYLQGP